MRKYFIKNISNEDVIEPHFNVMIPAGETKELDEPAATRLTVLRPQDVKIVDRIERKPQIRLVIDPAPVVEIPAEPITSPEPAPVLNTIA